MPVSSLETFEPSRSSLSFPTAILFDWDNTLVDSWEIILNGMTAVFEAFGLIAWTRTEVQLKCHYAAQKIFKDLFPQRSDEALDIFYRYINEHHLEQLCFLEGAKDLLDFLREKNIPIGIVSNKKNDLLRKEVAFLKITDNFKVIVGAGDTPFDKPHPYPIEFALNQMQLSAHKNIWYIGDTPTDWIAATDAGLTPVLMQVEPIDQVSFSTPHDVLHFLKNFAKNHR